jgi:hypothetical protein
VAQVTGFDMKDKFQTLQPWLSQVLHTIKKEIKAEHLSKSPIFYKAHFGNRPLNRLTNEEICVVYEKELLQGDNEEMGEWVINRWVFRHGDIYQHFAERLTQIHPDFDEIKSLNDMQSEQVLSGSVESFGAISVYLFTVLNGVVISPSVLGRLRSAAEKEQAKLKTELETALHTENLEQILERQKNELVRVEKKYEDKLAGVMKKHATDVEALKKQVRSLQLKLNSK